MKVEMKSPSLSSARKKHVGSRHSPPLSASCSLKPADRVAYLEAERLLLLNFTKCEVASYSKLKIASVFSQEFSELERDSWSCWVFFNVLKNI